MEKNNKIYMDVYSYNRYLEGINKLIEDKKIVDYKMGLSHKRGTEESWDNAEYDELKEESFRLQTEINNRRLSLVDIVIVDYQNNEEIVDFGDVLRLTLVDQYGTDEIVGKLVGDAKKCAADSEYLEISVNGLVGSLIYGKKVGEKVSYVVDDFTCYVHIMEKVNVKQEVKTGMTKKLVNKNK